MAPEIHFAESERERQRQEVRLGGDKLGAPAPEPIRKAEDFIPGRDRWKKRRRTAKRLPGTMCLPKDIGLIDWFDK